MRFFNNSIFPRTRDSSRFPLLSYYACRDSTNFNWTAVLYLISSILIGGRFNNNAHIPRRINDNQQWVRYFGCLDCLENTSRWYVITRAEDLLLWKKKKTLNTRALKNLLVCTTNMLKYVQICSNFHRFRNRYRPVGNFSIYVCLLINTITNRKTNPFGDPMEKRAFTNIQPLYYVIKMNN